MRRGAYFSILLTAALGVRIGYAGFIERAEKAGQESAAQALRVGIAPPVVAGASQTDMVRVSLQSGALVPFAFFLFTPLGWLADYLFLSAIFRGVTLAVDAPWGDPLLSVLDDWIRGRNNRRLHQHAAEAREKAEGIEVPDQILECRRFAGKDADFVVVASRRKEGWTLATTVIANEVRLRIGDPREMTIEGHLRTCYPLAIIRDIQVDRRMVHYDWPADAPPLTPPEDAPF